MLVEGAGSETGCRYANRNAREQPAATLVPRVLSVVVMEWDDSNGIDERSLRFFCDVLAFVDTIPLGPKTKKLVEQLVDSAGSIGANREEALGGSSRREFIRFNEISLRSANE